MAANLDPKKPIVSQSLFDTKGFGGTFDQWKASGSQTMPSIAPSQVNDNVMDKVVAYSAKDNPLMVAARASGMKMANRRGLLNSSMAANASQDAALQQVVPIASQDASQDFQRNQGARAFEYGMVAQDVDIKAKNDLFTREAALQEKLQKGQFTHEDQQQLRDIQTKMQLFDKEAALQTKLQSGQFTHEDQQQLRDIQNKLQLFDKDASLRKSLQADEFAFNKDQQTRDINFRTNLFDKDASLQLRKQELDNTFNSGQNALNRALQEKLSKWQLDITDKGNAAQFLTNMEQLYQNQYNTIMNNTNLDQATRETFLASAKALRDKQLNFVEQMYNIDLRW